MTHGGRPLKAAAGALVKVRGDLAPPGGETVRAPSPQL